MPYWLYPINLLDFSFIPGERLECHCGARTFSCRKGVDGGGLGARAAMTITNLAMCRQGYNLVIAAHMSFLIDVIAAFLV